MKVGFVCTNYNNAPVTRDYVASLARCHADIRIVVVDNHSQVGDHIALRELAAEHSMVDLIELQNNIGYFPGLNIGIRYLRTQHPTIQHIVVGNNDLEFPLDFVETITANPALFERHAVIAPDLVDLHGQHQNPHVLSRITRWRRSIWDIYYASFSAARVIHHLAAATRQFTARAENDPASTLYRSARLVEQGYGACYILGPVFFQHFDQLCAPTFLMQEEYFLTEQLRSIGQLPFYDPRFRVKHLHHATMGRVPRRQHWELSRAAHRVYKYYRALPESAQRSFITHYTTGPQ